MNTTPTYTQRRSDCMEYTSHTFSIGATASVVHFIPDNRDPHTAIYLHNVTAVIADEFGYRINTERGNFRIHVIAASNVWPAPDPTDLSYMNPQAPRKGRTMNARERLAEILDDYPPTSDQEDAPTLDDLDGSADRICLIETNTRSGAHWLTLWLTAHDAVKYHHSSEYPGDYDIVDIVDLDNGNHYESTHTARKVSTS